MLVIATFLLEMNNQQLVSILQDHSYNNFRFGNQEISCEYGDDSRFCLILQKADINDSLGNTHLQFVLLYKNEPQNPLLLLAVSTHLFLVTPGVILTLIQEAIWDFFNF